MPVEDDQAQELAALESIYPSELTVLRSEFPAQFTVRIESEGTSSYSEDGEESSPAIVTVEFTYTDTYPESPPEIAISDFENLQDEDCDTLLDFLNAEQLQRLLPPFLPILSMVIHLALFGNNVNITPGVPVPTRTISLSLYVKVMKVQLDRNQYFCRRDFVELPYPLVSACKQVAVDALNPIDGGQLLAAQNVGMPMIFTLISGLQEQLNCLIAAHKQRAEDEEERRKQEEEEKERKRFEGTRVTVDAFMAWKSRFDAEMALLRKTKAFDANKLTGKQQFLADATLSLSDIQIIQEAGDDLKIDIDESLFAEELDDLELDEDDEETIGERTIQVDSD